MLGVMMMMRAIALSLFSVGLFAGSAFAQPLPAAPANGGRLDVKPLNFDLWCQETQKLPPDRCDKRLPEDDQAFDDYRAKVEKYEVPYLKNKEDAATLNRTIIHSEPTELPVNNPQQPPSPNP